MQNWRNRLKASAIHLLISVAVAILAACLVFGLWYPYPYREISGGRELFWLVIGVDITIGPLITFVIFNQAKSPRHLAMDFTVIGILQLAALGYGLWTVFIARPVHLVFEYHRLAVVHAIDIEPKMLAQAPKDFQKLPLNGPTLLSLRAFRSADEQFSSTMQAMAGLAQAAQPSLWQPYSVARVDILKKSQSIEQLKKQNINQVDMIDKAIAKTGYPADRLRYLPMLVRKNAWTVLIDKETALPVEFLPIDSF